MIDRNGDGYLDRNELTRVCGSLGCLGSRVELLLRDLNGDGKLSFEEFYRIIYGRTVPTTWVYRTFWSSVRVINPIGGSTILAPST